MTADRQHQFRFFKSYPARGQDVDVSLDVTYVVHEGDPVLKTEPYAEPVEAVDSDTGEPIPSWLWDSMEDAMTEQAWEDMMNLPEVD